MSTSIVSKIVMRATDVLNVGVVIIVGCPAEFSIKSIMIPIIVIDSIVLSILC